jgi:hypothetical protein
MLRVDEWRSKAVENFPELREELNDTDEIFSPYALWWELLSLATEAHRATDDDLLRRIYGYASWSYEQGGDLANAVAVSFYEHLLDERWMRPLTVPWLNARVVKDIRTLWSDHLSAEEMREVELLISSGTSNRHP